eukprot:13939151-Alexandrium_andersonii.AAC.1
MLVSAPIRLNPQSAMRKMRTRYVFEPGTAWPQERPQNWSPKFSTGAFCAVVSRRFRIRPRKRALR